MSATLPTLFMTRGFRFRPTMNSNNAMPKVENVEMSDSVFIMFRKYGLTRIPVRMYPIIIGCFRNLRISEMTNATPIIMLSSMNKFASIILFYPMLELYLNFGM